MKTDQGQWTKVRLGDICELRYGKSLPEGQRQAGAIPVFGSNGIVGHHDKAISYGPTIIVGRKGSLGEVNYSSSDCWPIDTTYYIDRSSTEADLQWLSYRLKGLGLTELNKAAAVPGLNRNDAYERTLLLPPLPEQQRIAAILDAADALREKRRQAIAKLDIFMNATFLEMFGDPNENPKGWHKMKMGDLMLIRRGGSPRPIEKFLGGSINWIKIGDATTGSDIYIEQCSDKITPDGLTKTVFLKAGSVIFANCGVSLGFARILKVDGCIHDGWLSLEKIPEDRLDKIFLLKALNAITQYFRDMAPSGTQPNLNTTLMKNFRIILPPIELQRRFAKCVERVGSLKDKQVRSLAQLDTLFTSLQQRAFRGEL